MFSLLSSSDINKNSTFKESDLDKTGINVDNRIHALEILHNESGIIIAKYNNLDHTFWRAQEFSLFSQQNKFLSRPMLDFGCGDGSFASTIFRAIDYGVDNDLDALGIAEKWGVYNNLLQSSISKIPILESCVSTVISNSVLEHLGSLDQMLLEINRVLVKGGEFIFTVPVLKFKKDLEKYFGRKVSELINCNAYHRNLLTIEEWKSKLDACGFSIVVLKQYQPDWFTFWYRMLGLLGHRKWGKFLPKINTLIWKHLNKKIINMVKESVCSTTEGGAVFVVARKIR